MSSFARSPVSILCVSSVTLLLAGRPCAAQTQTTPAPTQPSPDSPTVKAGGTIFTDYTYQQTPKIVDSDGNAVSQSQFEITRAYINLTGTITRHVSFRLTTDVARETGVGSTLNGSYTVRLKFAYGQFNLEDWLGEDAYGRLGVQPTPWIYYMDDIYRYRFQGQEFEERDGFLTFSDAGASFHYAFPSDYGDVHTGYYNGDGYSKFEPNDQKGFQTRGSVRPFARGPKPLFGLRVNGFYDHDAYVKNADRRRVSTSVTFEHKYVNAAFDFMAARDQTSVNKTAVNAREWSVWATPKTTKGWEGLLRYDHGEPNTTLPNQIRKRTIGGVAYWFARQPGLWTAIMFDVDNVTFDSFTTAQPTVRKYGVHAMFNF
jgi:hypothetical protein